MAFFNRFLALTISIILSHRMIFTIADQEAEYRDHVCTENATFPSHSIYLSNLNDLLQNLSARATPSAGSYSFYQLRAGSSGNTVYGSYLCRGDVDAGVCGDCVATAAKAVTELCPRQKEAIVWYDVCMLRYANGSFFNAMESSPIIMLVNTVNASNQSEFLKALATVTRDFTAEAENGAKRFLTKEIEISGLETMYGLMQCTPDLSGDDCTKCLDNSIAMFPKFFAGKQGATVLAPSCNIRLEVYPFYYKDSGTEPVFVPTTPPPTMTTDRPSSAPPGKGSGISAGAIAAIIIAVIVAFLALGCCLLCNRKRIKMKKYDVVRQENGKDSLQFELIAIEKATNNFSQDYKLGEGGFGEVYKGIFSSGQELAVKRLSKHSGQGAEEFKNEVALVAKLQHRNLVRLLGFCLEGGETLLVYEFVPNKSLDYFLFDPDKRELLDWLTRSKIVGGICRGILYLHEDSRLRVIHRDLKASNVLLDGDMNPKISDFGMARMVGIDQTQGNTKRIVGTYGYMAPEYAMEGLYSVKSDVFSFGVLLLEIISGKKNSGFHLTKSAPSLLAFAWQLWNEGRGLELMDELLRDLCPPNEFLRYIHIGLLCVQEDAYNRPTISNVLMMLTSESTSLPKPERPAFSVGRLIADDNNNKLCDEGCSDNGLTISHFGPR